MRQAVWRAIEREATQPSLWQLLRWQPLLATSCALLLLFSGWAIYLFLTESKRPSGPAVVKTYGPATPEPLPLRPAEEKDQLAPEPVEPSERGGFSSKTSRKRLVIGDPIPVIPAPLVEQISTAQAGIATAPNAPDSTSTDTKQAQEMLRIEIQTADPNIRIIWFVPKEPSAPSSRTGTDAQ